MTEQERYSNIKKKIIKILDDLLEGEQWESSFFLKAMYGRFDALRKKLKQELNHENVQPKISSPESYVSGSEPARQLKTHEKIVYARIYHKDIQAVAAHRSVPWLKALLESIKHNEKLGIAIYAQEEEVKKSIKSIHYAYVKVLVRDEQQDITHKRGPKKDPIIGCNLLVIQDLKNEDLLTLVHNNIEYNLQDGILMKW